MPKHTNKPKTFSDASLTSANFMIQEILEKLENRIKGSGGHNAGALLLKELTENSAPVFDRNKGVYKASINAAAKSRHLLKIRK